MVLVEGGCFDMGDTFDDGWSHEKPAHTVCLDSFYLDQYEVTQQEFEDILGFNPAKHEGCPDCPIDQALWEEGSAYCEALGKRLPTEAEWEFAARERGRHVRYGNGADDITTATVNYGYSLPDGLAPVGSYPPNALGLYDMAGNVWEWVSDFWSESYYQESPVDNPQGPTTGDRHVCKGGSYEHVKENNRASFRWGLQLIQRGYDNGFRCARDYP